MFLCMGAQRGKLICNDEAGCVYLSYIFCSIEPLIGGSKSNRLNRHNDIHNYFVIRRIYRI